MSDPTAPHAARDPDRPPSTRWSEARRLDEAIYTAIARTSSPATDRAMRRLAGAADYSRLSMAVAAGLSIVGGRSGRSAAAEGLACVAATSAVANVIIKPLGRRRRPDREGLAVPADRHVPMPDSRSFPSGHAACAFAFASGVSRTLPLAGAPIFLLAATVAYSRVHTGVHFPSDVVAGALLGLTISDAVGSSLGGGRG